MRDNKNSTMAGGEAVCFGTAYDHFAESAELCGLIDALPHTCSEQVAMEASQERVTGSLLCCSCALTSHQCHVPPPHPPHAVILNKYQEQPHLLDPHLGEFDGVGGGGKVTVFHFLQNCCWRNCSRKCK